MRLRKVLFSLVVLLITAVPVFADISSSLLVEYHPYDQLGISIAQGGDLKDLERTLQNPEVRILILQVPFHNYDYAWTEPIVSWVRKGHALWYYDSRYAPLFGMMPYKLHSSQFRGKAEAGNLGPEKVSGCATVALPIGTNPVTAGVGQTLIFLPEVAPNIYSSVEVTADTVPLLQFAANSPALAAYRRDGLGLFVFKPLLWVKSMSGERFQLNMLEFSAGFGVPGPGGQGRYNEYQGAESQFVEGSPAFPLLDAELLPKIKDFALGKQEIVGASQIHQNDKDEAENSNHNQSLAKDADLDNTPVVSKSEFPYNILYITGETLSCQIDEEFVQFESSSESLSIPSNTVSSITVGNSYSLDRLTTVDGKEYTGFLLAKKLYIRTPEGSKEITKSDFKTIILK